MREDVAERADGTGRRVAGASPATEQILAPREDLAARPRRRRVARILALAAVLAAALAGVASPPGGSPAIAGEPPVRKLPFSDDLPPPPPLPEPLDRRFHAKLVAFDGDRVGYRWAWESAEETDDFEPFVPVRATVRGSFERSEGGLRGEGTAGLRLRLGMLSDLKVGVDATLGDPHDLGIVLSAPGSSDESILCLVQDRFFTRFDAAAGNTNMINKMGGIPPESPGVVEFRYVDRKPQPKLAKGHRVRFDVVRKGPETSFSIAPRGEPATVLAGKDTDTPMTRFQPGIYVAGSSAVFGALEIEGRIDPKWCQENGVLPHVAADLLHPGNRFKGAERKAAEAVETFVKQQAAPVVPDPKVAVPPEALAAIVGDAKLPLVIRIRAAEALAGDGEAEGGAGADVSLNIARLLDAADLETRVLAWRVLRPRLPWHFRYEPDGEPKMRRDASLLVAAYLKEADDAAAQGKVFFEGYWYTPARADQIRANWEKAWDLRGPHVRLKTNMTREWADWTYAALEAGFRELVRVTGREPPPERLPVSILVFSTTDDYRAFMTDNGYEDKAGWKRFCDLDRGAGFDTFDRRTMPAWPLHLLAKQMIRTTTAMAWPTWFEEGRASWFASGDLKNASFDGTTLKVAQPPKSVTASDFSAWATQDKIWATSEFLGKDPRALEGEERRKWYAQAWALHTFLMDAAPDEDRRRFAEWQSTLENLKPGVREVEAMGRRIFLALWARELDGLDQRFRDWARKL